MRWPAQREYPMKLSNQDKMEWKKVELDSGSLRPGNPFTFFCGFALQNHE